MNIMARPKLDNNIIRVEITLRGKMKEFIVEKSNDDSESLPTSIRNIIKKAMMSQDQNLVM